LAPDTTTEPDTYYSLKERAVTKNKKSIEQNTYPSLSLTGG
jgi:hypothetical protein